MQCKAQYQAKCFAETAALDALKKLKPEDRKKIEKSLAVRVAPPTDKQLKRQQLQDLKQSLELAQQRVQARRLHSGGSS